MFKKVNGDILIPETRGRKVIVCHQVNCKGVMGAGLAKQIRDTCPGVFDSYRCEVMRITAARYSSGMVLQTQSRTQIRKHTMQTAT